jgi:hypothetical protein
MDTATAARIFEESGAPLSPDELAELDAMTPEQRAEQITYLSDYQG